MKTIIIDGNNLTLEDFIEVVRFKAKVSLSDVAKEKVVKCRAYMEQLISEDKVIYGVNTGFGKLSQVKISLSDTSKLQENLLKSHACGVGEYLDEESTRGVMLLRINALAKGYSGIRLSTLERLIFYLNEGILPLIPEKGSLGASGDLAPLAHMALTLIGIGKVRYKGEILDINDVLSKCGIKPLDGLLEKEGLALINGTQVMTSIGAIATYDAFNLVKLADIAGSMTMEALYGIIDAMDGRVSQVRGHAGQIQAAENIRLLTENSEFITHQGDKRTQDAYVLRCLPVVHGAVKDALKHIKEKVEIEMNAATDNPLIFPDYNVISGGNFHGEPMAIVFDYLKIALSELANISERRIERLVNPQLNEGLPAFLIKNGGLNSGFMILQYVAASLVSENKMLSHPASVDSIPSSANQEDHVSMGTISARYAREISKNVQTVLALELLCCAQAIDLREKKRLGKGTKVAYEIIRKHIPFIEEDYLLKPLIDIMIELVQSNIILQEVENVVGKLR